MPARRNLHKIEQTGDSKAQPFKSSENSSALHSARHRHTDCQAVAATQLPQPPSPHQLNVLQLFVDLPAATRSASYPRNVVSALHSHLSFARSLDSLSVRKMFHLLVDIPSIPVERAVPELLSQSTLQLRPAPELLS